MKIRKAIIPAAGLGTRFLPATKAQPKEMLPLVDKPTIQYIVEEAVESGIEDIIIISGRGKRAIEDHFDKSYELEETLEQKGKWELLESVKQISNLANIHYIRQKDPRGLGHAIHCASRFIGNEPFAVLLGDDVMFNPSGEPALKQMINLYSELEGKGSIIGVKEVLTSDVEKYGIVDPKRNVNAKNGNYMELNGLVEKPAASMAPSNYAIMGRYILSPSIFNILEFQEPGSGGEIQLTDAINELNNHERVYALELLGKRYDVGDKFGFIEATIDLALMRNDLKDSVLEMLREKIKTN